MLELLSALYLVSLLGLPTLQQIAFVAPDGPAKKNYTICVVNIDGTGFRRITSSPCDDDFCQWSSNGEWLCFARQVEPPGDAAYSGISHIYVARRDGTSLTQVTSGSFFDLNPTWTTDGKRVSFSRRGNTYEVGMDAKGLIKIERHNSVSPDGKWAVNIEMTNRNWTLRLQSPGSTKWVRLARFQGNDVALVWAPNGRNLVLNLERDGGSILYSIAIPSGKRTILSSGAGAHFGSASFSPDGRRIAFNKADFNAVDKKQDLQVYVMNADGSGTRLLTNSWGNSCRPQWTRDGRSLVIESARNSSRLAADGTSRIYLIDVATGAERAIPLPVVGPFNHRVGP